MKYSQIDINFFSLLYWDNLNEFDILFFDIFFISSIFILLFYGLFLKSVNDFYKIKIKDFTLSLFEVLLYFEILFVFFYFYVKFEFFSLIVNWFNEFSTWFIVFIAEWINLLLIFALLTILSFFFDLIFFFIDFNKWFFSLFDIELTIENVKTVIVTFILAIMVLLGCLIIVSIFVVLLIILSCIIDEIVLHSKIPNIYDGYAFDMYNKQKNSWVLSMNKTKRKRFWILFIKRIEQKCFIFKNYLFIQLEKYKKKHNNK